MTEPLTIALVAACATLIVAFLTQFVAEKYRRFHDGSAVAAGLAGELSAYKHALPQMAKTLREWGSLEHGHEGLILRPMDKPVDVFYPSAVPKLGLLGVDMVEDVVYVYSNINAFRMAFDMLSKSFQDMSPAEFRMRASFCFMVLDQANTRGERLVPRLRQRANARFRFS